MKPSQKDFSSKILTHPKMVYITLYCIVICCLRWGVRLESLGYSASSGPYILLLIEKLPEEMVYVRPQV